MEEAYAGIDVSVDKTKRLPVVVCVRRGRNLELLDLHNLPTKPPMGVGNARILKPSVVDRFAREVVNYLRAVERAVEFEFNVRISRIAIDAPSDPKKAGEHRRQAELGLDRLGISYFATPSADEFETICKRASEHLASGGKEAKLPEANRLWMLSVLRFSAFSDRIGNAWRSIRIPLR